MQMRRFFLGLATLGSLAAGVPLAAQASGERDDQAIEQDRESVRQFMRLGLPDQARPILRSLCFEDSDATACQNYGVMAMTGEGGATDMTDGRAAFRKGCDGRLFKSCQNYADALVNGEGGAVDDPGALGIYLWLCQNSYGARNCFRAASMVEEGRGVTEADPAKAQEGYRRACELRFRPACERVRSEP